MVFHTIIIGAGVLGLAIAQSLSKEFQPILVIEKKNTFGTGISSRNSEVIHAGIYYKPDSLKALHCVKGRNLLYSYCASKSIRHARLGKLIVATSTDEEEKLHSILERSLENNLDDRDKLIQLSKREACKLEPELNCCAALYSPSTGILDSHSLMQNFIWDAELAGTTFSYGTEVQKIELGEIHKLFGQSRGEKFEIRAKNIVVATGLGLKKMIFAPHIALPETYYLKGNYFKYRHSAPFKHLIYPVPVKGGLGVHITLDLDGRLKFGPDTEEIESEDYAVSKDRLPLFESSIRKYWPTLPSDSLIPDYAGIRPKIRSHEEVEQDFIIEGPEKHGFQGVYIFQGIESPGLTSSMSLAVLLRDEITKSENLG